MDKLERYRAIIEQVLIAIAATPYHLAHIKDRAVIDRQADQYLIIREGWEKNQRVHGCVVHLEIIDGKIWIQEDGLERGIAADLEAAGIPKSDIVLGFYPPDVRPHTEYAAA